MLMHNIFVEYISDKRSSTKRDVHPHIMYGREFVAPIADETRPELECPSVKMQADKNTCI